MIKAFVHGSVNPNTKCHYLLIIVLKQKLIIMSNIYTPFKEFIFFGKWFSDPTEKRARKQQLPKGSILSKIMTASLCLVLSFFSINLTAQENLQVSNDTSLCAPAEFCPNATVTDILGNGIPNLEIIFDVRGANPSRFPLTGTGSTSGSGSCIHCFDFLNAGKDSIIITVDAPGGIISDTICVSTFDADDKPVAKAKKEYCVYLDAQGQAIITPDSLDDGSQAPCGLQGLAINKSSFICADIAASPVLVKFTVTGTNGKNRLSFYRSYRKRILFPHSYYLCRHNKRLTRWEMV